MRIAYFDCFSGISGDMILAALIDLGLKPEELKKELKKVALANFELKLKRVKKKEISAIDVEVITRDKKRRKLEDIRSIIDRSSLDDEIKKSAKKIFTRLATLEAKIHREVKKDIHFHELGNLDTIIDVVGVLVGIKNLGIKKIYSSPLHLGSGFARCAHNVLPVPVPATLGLVAGVPIYGKDIEGELVTPTGAVLITSLAQEFGKLPLMKVDRIGYGAGKNDFPIPNLLRILLGEEDKVYDEDIVSLIQTNIDDMNPQIYSYLMDKLFQKGALDVWFTPIQMKKNRPAINLSVLADKKDVDKVCEVIFNESTTLGVRILELKRKKLSRQTRTLKTKYGRIRVKVARANGLIKNITPDYEDCQKLAKKLKLPFKRIYEQAKNQALKLLKNKL